MIGLKRGTVKLLPHDLTWESLFNQEKSLLIETLGDCIVGIEHIGSTSVPGIAAKPIIDIDIGIDSINDLKSVEEIALLIKPLGYVWRRQNSNPDNHIFAKGPEECRTFYVHLVEYKGEVWNNDVLFRSYLTLNPKVAKDYENLKLSLAQKYPNIREKYTVDKKNFIIKVLKLAKV